LFCSCLVSLFHPRISLSCLEIIFSHPLLISHSLPQRFISIPKTFTATFIVMIELRGGSAEKKSIRNALLE
uniref:Ovule protein n=1 Tax=Parascaris equorum TaxID=6256 RepID=A0A914S3J6_PAREQ